MSARSVGLLLGAIICGGANAQRVEDTPLWRWAAATSTPHAGFLETQTWWNPAQSGWGLFTYDLADAQGAAWYTYATDGRPTWFLVNGLSRSSDGFYDGQLLKFRGAPFDHPEHPGRGSGSPESIGVARIGYAIGIEPASGARHNRLHFGVQLKGREDVISHSGMMRFDFGSHRLYCSKQAGSSRATASNLTDTWWNPSNSGWGLQLLHIQDGLYGAWFTFDQDGEPTFFTLAGSRQESGRFTGQVFRPGNGRAYTQFDVSTSFPDQAVSTPSSLIGDFELSPLDGERASFKVQQGGRAMVEQPIQRFAAGTRVVSCVDSDQPVVTIAAANALLQQMLQPHPDGGNDEFVALDLDADADPDLIRITSIDAVQSQRMQVYRNVDGQYLREWTENRAWARTPVVADFNNDGRDDVFFADHGFDGVLDGVAFPGAQDTLFLQDANGDLMDSTSRLPVASDFSHGACAADFNGDGRLDLLKSIGWQQKVLLNRGEAGFEYRPDYISPNFDHADPGYLSHINYTVNGPFPSFQCTAGDYREIGRADAVLGGTGIRSGVTGVLPTVDPLGNLVGKAHIVLRNDPAIDKLRYIYPDSVLGAGTAAEVNVNVPNGASPHAVSAGTADFDSDGCLDAAVYHTEYHERHGLDVYFGDCSGGFALREVELLADFDPFVVWKPRLHIADVDDSGHPDLVLHGWFVPKNPRFLSARNDVYVVLSLGDRSFSVRRGDFELFPGLPLYAKLAFGPDLEF